MTLLICGALQVAEAAQKNDAVDKAWQQRAEQARKKLAGPGLDECDKGLERAFASVKQMPSNDDQRAYALNIEVAGQTMQAAYFYNGAQLTDFMLVSLPQSWMAKQKTNSKLLSILVMKANCALDLCTDDPFSGGACPKKAQ